MEAVAVHVPFLPPSLRDRVGRGRRRHRAVESGIEHRDVRDVRQRLARTVDLLERPTVVERSEDRKLLDGTLDGFVDHHRLLEVASAVHDAVADGVRWNEALHGTGFVLLDEVKLEARGACVDNQDVQRKGFS